MRFNALFVSLASTLSRRPQLFTSLVLLISLMLGGVIVWKMEVNRLDTARAQVYALASDRANKTQNHFDHVATKMLPDYPGVSVLIYAPDGIIAHAVPIAGNEAAIGLNLLQDPVMRAETQLARNAGKLTLAGPLALRQGGTGLVARLPIFWNQADGTTSFWGFVNVVLKLPQALDPVKLPELSARGFNYKLWRIVPESGQMQVIMASSNQALPDPVRKSFSVPNGGWTLSVCTTAGWAA